MECCAYISFTTEKSEGKRNVKKREKGEAKIKTYLLYRRETEGET